MASEILSKLLAIAISSTGLTHSGGLPEVEYMPITKIASGICEERHPENPSEFWSCYNYFTQSLGAYDFDSKKIICS